MEQGHKDALKVQALTQRIAQIVAQYEHDLADLRAEANIMIGELEARVRELESERDADVAAPQEPPADKS